jgi:hypothetical protein
MRFQYYLTEKKDHIIKKLKNLSKEEKDQLIPLFSTNNPKLEKMIDWNNKNLTFKDFKEVLNFRSKTSVKKKVKSQGIKGLKANKDYIELKNISDTYNAYIPLTYEASKFIASKNIGGCEGRWCTAYQKTKSYWIDYVEARNITLIYLIGNDTKYAVAMYPGRNGMYEIFDSDDSHTTNIPDFDMRKLDNSKMIKLYSEIQKKYFTTASFVDEADTIDPEFEVKNENYVIWYDGIWKSGEWVDGEWYNGLWKNGLWKEGFWEQGTWKNGTWENGVWFNGTWYNGIWYDGVWKNGSFKGGKWMDGKWEGGIFDGGTWYKGEWILGKWKGGYDRKGNYHDEGDSPDLWDDMYGGY